MSLSENLRGDRPKTAIDPDGERLTGVAIIRNGVTESRGFKTHSDLRRALGDENPYVHRRGDVEGFLTSTGRFVDRSEAKRIGVQCGQLAPDWLTTRWDLLSADIENW